MALTQHLKIDNSLESAIKNGNGRGKKVEFYKKLMRKVEWKELLQEAYLVAPVENIQNDENGFTPYTKCDFYYSHHEIQNDKLVLSIPKLKKAFLHAVTDGTYSGEVKKHLERHMKDLEGIIDFNAVFISDLEGVCECIEEKLRNLCSSASEYYIQETTQYIFGILKYKVALRDAWFWVDSGKHWEYQSFSVEERYELAEAVINDCFLTEPWKMLIGSQLKKEKVKEFYEDLYKRGYGGNTYGFTEFMIEYFRTEITYNILDFIDFEDMREYNQNIEFTPIEEASLIYHSRKTTVDEKMKDWRELLGTYSEEEFEWTRYGKRRFNEKTNRQILENAVTEYENALSQRNLVDNVIFEARFYECDYLKSDYPVCFSNYKEALAYIEEEKKSCLEDEELRECQTKAEIYLKQLGTQASEDIIYYFDNELRMVNIFPGTRCLLSDCYEIDEGIFRKKL